MLHEFFAFSGLFFWSVIAIYSMIIISIIDGSDEYIIPWSIGLAIILYGFSNTPLPPWQWAVGYICVGLLNWFIVFNIKLAKLKKFLISKNLNTNTAIREYAWSSGEEKYYRTWKSEPSLETFISRTICWPMSLVRTFFGDVLESIYNACYNWMISYKKRFLGLSDEVKAEKE